MANARTGSDILASKSGSYAADYATFYESVTGQEPPTNPVRDGRASWAIVGDGELANAIADAATTAAGLLGKISPSTVPTGQLATDVGTADEALGNQAAVDAFRTRVGNTTLGGGYGGDAADDNLSALLAFLAAQLPV